MININPYDPDLEPVACEQWFRDRLNFEPETIISRIKKRRYKHTRQEWIDKLNAEYAEVASAALKHGIQMPDHRYPNWGYNRRYLKEPMR